MKRRIFTLGRVALGLALSGLMVWLVTRGLEWHRFVDSFRGMSVSLIVGGLIIFMIAGYIRAIRWQTLFVRRDVSTTRLFIIQNEGIGLNNILPVRVASEFTQVAVLSVKERVTVPTALATLGMERVVDLVASTLILCIALLLLPQLETFSRFVWAAVALTVAALVLLRLVSWGSEGLGWTKRVQFLADFLSALRELEARRSKMVASMLLSILYWLLIGVTAWFVAVAINLPISPMIATLAIMGTIFVSTAVPAAPGAIGIFEGGVIYVLDFFGVSKEVSLGFALIAHLVFFIPPAIIAAIYLPREGLNIMDRLRGRTFGRPTEAPAS